MKGLWKWINKKISSLYPEVDHMYGSIEHFDQILSSSIVPEYAHALKPLYMIQVAATSWNMSLLGAQVSQTSKWSVYVRIKWSIIRL